MANMVAQQDQATSHLTSLLSTALEQHELSGLSEVLRNIAEAVEACGCILWEVAPVSRLNDDPPSGRLFVLAQSFQAERTPIFYELPYYSSRTGEAVSTKQTINLTNVEADKAVHRDDFIEQMRINSMCIVPIIFTDGNQGTVNVYRNCGRSFSDDEVRQIKDLASLVPTLYGMIIGRVSSDVSDKVTEDLRQAETRAAKSLLSKNEIKEVIQSICNRIADTLQCIETSIFFDDPLETPGIYSLIATTWPWLEHFWKNKYQKGDSGLTGWVLTKNEPIMIFDLANFDKDIQAIHSKYPGLVWEDSLRIKQDDIKRAIRDYLNLDEKAKLQPLSFMAVPIVMGEKVLGVIRCCTAKQGPYHFGNRELTFLKLIAAQLGQYWSNWLNRREMQEEIRTWQKLAEKVNQLNDSVLDKLIVEVNYEEHDFDFDLYQEEVFKDALESISSIISDAKILDIQILNEDTRNLYFAYTHGDAWSEGSEEERQQRLDGKFPVDGDPPQSIGAWVVQNKKSRLVKKLVDDRDGKFPEAKRLIVAPIKVEDKIFGVIDIRGVGSCDFPEHAEVIANLIGQQLGLYLHLAKTIVKLELGKTQQTQVFQDLGHQIRSPIIQAYKTVNSVIADEFRKLQSRSHDPQISDGNSQILVAAKLRLNLAAVRGLCGKARRVAASTRLFADLARGEPIKPDLSILTDDELVRILIEAATDNRVMTDPASHLRFHVKGQTFRIFDSVTVLGDLDLLGQAVNTVLDNAGKYSFEESEVQISGGLMEETEEFFISVLNKGIKILPGEVASCVKRHWRSEAARAVTGEGSGIGLWIVKHIMDAQSGRLEIVPTTKEYLTEVRLVLPFIRKSGGHHAYSDS
jgi:GAF domain-containing protein/signal transduction histidine kinase